MADPKLQNNAELLDAMMGDLWLQDDLYRLSPYWERYCGRIARRLKATGIENFRNTSRTSATPSRSGAASE